MEGGGGEEHFPPVPLGWNSLHARGLFESLYKHSGDHISTLCLHAHSLPYGSSFPSQPQHAFSFSTENMQTNSSWAFHIQCSKWDTDGRKSNHFSLQTGGWTLCTFNRVWVASCHGPQVLRASMLRSLLLELPRIAQGGRRTTTA